MTKVETHGGVSLKIDKLHGFVLRIRLDIDNFLVKAPVWKGKTGYDTKKGTCASSSCSLQQSEA